MLIRVMELGMPAAFREWLRMRVLAWGAGWSGGVFVTLLGELPTVGQMAMELYALWSVEWYEWFVYVRTVAAYESHQPTYRCIYVYRLCIYVYRLCIYVYRLCIYMYIDYVYIYVYSLCIYTYIFKWRCVYSYMYLHIISFVRAYLYMCILTYIYMKSSFPECVKRQFKNRCCSANTKFGNHF